jgi:formimidoylglutamate deiminase
MPSSSLFFAELLLPEGWVRDARVTIDQGVITAIAPGALPQAGETKHGVGLPGLPNLHSHAFQRGMAGLAEVRGQTSDSFWSWREVMYRFLGILTPDDVAVIAALAYAEMLEAGFTRVGEFHYLHHDAAGQPYARIGEMADQIAAAAAETGIALTLLPVLYAHSNFGGTAPVHGQRRFICDRSQFAALMEQGRQAIATLPDAAIGVAPHSLRAVTPAELADVVTMAAGAPVHIHVAEQMKEVDDCLAWSGQRPVAWLLDHADVGANWCLIHATHMTDAETASLARSGAVAGLCPITEGSLGDGIFNGQVWLDAGGRYGVGTDSNILISAAGELRQLEYAQRLRSQQRNVMAPAANATTGRSLFQAALEGGSAALAGGPPGLRVGAPADIVALDATNMSLAFRNGDGWLDGWVFAAERAVDTVWRRGEAVVQGGRHVGREAIEHRYLMTLRRLMAAVLT